MNDFTLSHAILSGEAESLRNTMDRVELADGEVLFRRGDPGDAFYLIESGKIRIFTIDEGGQEITLNTLREGEAIGELALMDDRPRSASACALGRTVLNRLSREDFLAGVQASPELSRRIVRLLSQRTRHMTDYIERLGHWARLVAEGNYDQAMENIQHEGSSTDRALIAVADAVKSMVQAVQQREEELRQEVTQLRIQIDETKRKKQVAEITETDYFQKLAHQAQSLRKQIDE